MSDKTIMQESAFLLNPSLLYRTHTTLVLLLISYQIMHQFSFRFFAEQVLHDCPVCLFDLSIPEHLIQTRQSLAGLGKNDQSAHRTIQADELLPEKHFQASLYFSLRYCFTVSESGVSPVLSPCTISEAVLFTTMIWLSS